MRDLINIMERAIKGPSPLTNPAFRAWFGNSKVVDEQGEPLVLYHGTHSSFEAFRGMVWGSVTSSLANDYAYSVPGQGDSTKTPNILPIYMRIERPFDADYGLSRTVTIGQFFNAIMEQAAEAGFSITDEIAEQADHCLTVIRDAARREEAGPHFDRHNFWNETHYQFGRDGTAAIEAMFKMFGFDGVKMVEHHELTYGAFSPSQVKSVFSKGFDTSTDKLSEKDSGH